MNTWLQRLTTRLAAWWAEHTRPAPSPAPSAPTPPPPPPPPAQPTPALPLTASVSVVIPALNEAARIASVVRHALADPATAEVIVVDDSSIDDTVQLATEAGALVVRSSMLGKGPSMKDGLGVARMPYVVYLDGDLAGLRTGLISDLAAPLLRNEADFVKARFGRSGGRVTELTAKPMLKVFFPELAHFAQPLGGLIAARTSLLRSLRFEDAYGVDIGLLIDAHRAGARLSEVDIGSIENDSQALLDLTAMANEVSRVIYNRAREAGRLHMEQISAMYETQRLATATLNHALARRRGRQRVLLLDMDGTVTRERFVLRLAEATGHMDALRPLLDGQGDAATRGQAIAEVFKFVHRSKFESVAHALPLRPGVIEWVNQMRRAGFMVGLVSDSYHVAVDIVRRRLFADFAVAHTLQFDREVCTGQLHINPAFYPPDDSESIALPALCKSHVLQRMLQDPSLPRVQEVWAMGDNLNDLGMLRAAHKAFTIEPKAGALLALPGLIEVPDFAALLRWVPQASPDTPSLSPELADNSDHA